uniref:Uncharacterized protein n=1 Tax=Arundo donax TaxID=35708 RepID=A0A0A9FEC3_ARUDO
MSKIGNKETYWRAYNYLMIVDRWASLTRKKKSGSCYGYLDGLYHFIFVVIRSASSFKSFHTLKALIS